jgi:hypothetical protein
MKNAIVRKPLLLLLALLACAGLTPIARADAPAVLLARVPNGGLQPQIVARAGVWHLVYFKGDALHGDAFYVRSKDEGATWSAPLRVNSQAGSVVARGAIRGAMLAVGKGGRVHVVWNGSDRAAARVGNGAPLLYARLNDAGTAFEPQRNLLQNGFDLDGGGAVAADEAGHVYVAWHASPTEGGGEAARRVFLARSNDDGAAWSTPAAAWNEPTGACGCCQLGLMCDGDEVLLLYRSATAMVNRDVYLLRSADGGGTFTGAKIDTWKIGACPMSSFSFAQRGDGVLGAWECRGRVFWSALDAHGATHITAAGPDDNQKYPRLAVNARGGVLLAWVEAAGWGRGGGLHWRLFDAGGQSQTGGAQDGVPAWSFAAAAPRQDGGFTILY